MHIVSNGHELFEALLTFVRRTGETAMYPPCVVALTESTIAALVSEECVGELPEKRPSALSRLVEGAVRDTAGTAELRSYPVDLVRFAIRAWDGEIGDAVIELAVGLGFGENGLAYDQDDSGRLLVVSQSGFEEKVGVGVRAWAGSLPTPHLPTLAAR